MQLKDRKTVPLNEDKFMAERAELNTEKEEEKQFEQLDDPNRPVVKRDFYFNEAVGSDAGLPAAQGHAVAQWRGRAAAGQFPVGALTATIAASWPLQADASSTPDDLPGVFSAP